MYLVESERRANGAMGSIVNAGGRVSRAHRDNSKSQARSVASRKRSSVASERSDDTVKLEDLQEAQYNLDQKNSSTAVLAS